MKYDFTQLEAKWQKRWEENRVFEASVDQNLPKYYCLEMFPYPSGNIHMGHFRNYAIGDAIARHKFMRGFNVLHPIGWDAFGLPAENAAKDNKKHPAEWTYENIKNMRSQLHRMGLSYDWSREIATCDPDYYRWEQELFIKMWEAGLAYKKLSKVNWCESCGTVLANEQVDDGFCWRCGNLVVQKELEQWFFKITDYSEELLDNMQNLPGWPEKVLTMQRNWIGKSVGAEITFDIWNRDEKITVFSTRPDTIYGATFMLLAPEHPLSLQLIAATEYEHDGVEFIKEISSMSRENRLTDKEKRGFFTGSFCINPLTCEEIPIYIANYVLTDYGTGAVMAVPAHDERDFDFAKIYNLPIRVVISPAGEIVESELNAAYTGSGALVNSDSFDGLPNEDAQSAIVELLESMGAGKKSISYRLRDWGVSRQRYWGTPIPFVYCDKCGIVPVKLEDLPILLPKNAVFTGAGNPLEMQEFVETTCPKCGGAARRETDTMDTFVESSWYYLRYCSPKYDKGLFDKEEAAYWGPVDQYVGGIEHAVLHLLYSRFFTKVLRDMGWLSYDEPFLNLLTQGMVCKETHRSPNHNWLYPKDVKNGKCSICGERVTVGRVEKMSKSKHNVVDPDELLDAYGADALRLFSLFASPPEKEIEWSDSGVEGCFRFANRVFRLVDAHIGLLNSDMPPLSAPKGGKSSEIFRHTHAAIMKVTADIERFQLNTAIAAIMEFVNALYIFQNELKEDDDKGAFKAALISLIKLLAPFTPHLSEELWEQAGFTRFVSRLQWPTYVESYTILDNVCIAVQVNGKVRAELSLARDASKDEVVKAALQNSRVKAHIDGKVIVKQIYVPSKLLSIVVE
ncbi:MAG: leucine--tRNA ligase [Deferribacteraceae bacterium]|jgi:leucyl-tRNA synthetase|nr:leucine--tRNA ligase [Deferribacteraceae bacterium]